MSEDVAFEDEKQGLEEERRRRRRKARERTARRTKRATAKIIGNSDIGADLSAHGIFAAGVYFFQQGKFGYIYGSALLLMWLILSIIKRQIPQGEITKRLITSSSSLSFVASDLSVSLANYFSIAVGILFANRQDWFAAGYALLVCFVLYVLKYRLPKSKFLEFFEQDPSKTLEDNRTIRDL